MRAIATWVICLAAVACCDPVPPERTDAAAPGEPCVLDSDCPPGTRFSGTESAYNMRLCAYKIADGCGAVGHCADLPASVCSSYTPLCGCDGREVQSGPCMYAAGFASGPTTGAMGFESQCRDGGTP